MTWSENQKIGHDLKSEKERDSGIIITGFPRLQTSVQIHFESIIHRPHTSCTLLEDLINYAESEEVLLTTRLLPEPGRPGYHRPSIEQVTQAVDLCYPFQGSHPPGHNPSGTIRQGLPMLPSSTIGGVGEVSLSSVTAPVYPFHREQGAWPPQEDMTGPGRWHDHSFAAASISMPANTPHAMPYRNRNDQPNSLYPRPYT